MYDNTKRHGENIFVKLEYLKPNDIEQILQSTIPKRGENRYQQAEFIRSYFHF